MRLSESESLGVDTKIVPNVSLKSHCVCNLDVMYWFVHSFKKLIIHGFEKWAFPQPTYLYLSIMYIISILVSA